MSAAAASGTVRPAGRRPRRWRTAGWLALLALLAGTLVYGTLDDGGARSPDDRARALAQSIACPQCDGQSVADSDAEASRAIRERIDDRIDEGASDAQIRDELADSYGEQVLLTPGRSGVSSLVWSLPVAVLVLALAGVALAFRRWRSAGEAQASDDDRALVARALGTGTAGAGGDGR